jgi:(p)ppGpp synthase/HD superfamily hydrolase
LKYTSFQAAYPKDSDNVLSKIDQQEKSETAVLADFLKEVTKKIENLQAEV